MASLAQLHAHLEPYFLLNTLNAIARLVTADPRAARELLSDLGTNLTRVDPPGIRRPGCRPLR